MDASGEGEDPPWLATIFVPGPSLADAITAHGPLPPESLWRLAAGLVEALAAVHSRGLIHRDLKPPNVLLAADGPRVIDFGISQALDATTATATGMIVGTPSFMSPEQAESLPVGPASDVFSLGCVLAYAATGSGPFGAGTRPASSTASSTRSLLWKASPSPCATSSPDASLRTQPSGPPSAS